MKFEKTSPNEPGRPVTVGSTIFGGKELVLIAGPCTVESRTQMLETAFAMKEAGATMLRGGAYKPRTSPYAFQGLCEAGLEILAEARAATGLPVVTEVLESSQLERVAAVADVLQIGSRNMHNSVLLRAAGATQKPVLIKRGMSATLSEFLLAAEYVLSTGNEKVILCERGIRTFETATRFTLDLQAIPWIKQRSWVPIIVDPSHAAGDSALVPAMSYAAIACGADGVMIEAHVHPDQALCDGAQSETPESVFAMVKQLKAIAEASGRTFSTAHN